jgi:predicted O-methyltransferase YrrM
MALGGPFNGQKARARLFQDLIGCLQPQAIIETGTFLGTTTEFMAEAGLPVFTIEAHPRSFGFALARLRPCRNVTLLKGDSRAMLRSLFDGPLRRSGNGTLLFYLDAHWNDDLPLAEEVDLVFRRCPGAVVIVDDFAVPGDAGYAFDNYGPGKSLDAEYIGPAVAAHELAVFYPSTPAAEDTGARRGCVVLCREAMHGRTLSSFALLRRA